MFRRKWVIMDKDVSVDNSNPDFPGWTFRWCLKVDGDRGEEVRQSEATAFNDEEKAKEWLFKHQKKVRGGWTQWTVQGV